MTDLLLPLGATVLAAALTWWFCIRPMQRGRSCAHTPAAANAQPQGLDEEIRATREELRRLREQTAARPGPNPDAHNRPETNRR